MKVWRGCGTVTTWILVGATASIAYRSYRLLDRASAVGTGVPDLSSLATTTTTPGSFSSSSSSSSPSMIRRGGQHQQQPYHQHQQPSPYQLLQQPQQQPEQPQQPQQPQEQPQPQPPRQPIIQQQRKVLSHAELDLLIDEYEQEHVLRSHESAIEQSKQQEEEEQRQQQQNQRAENLSPKEKKKREREENERKKQQQKDNDPSSQPFRDEIAAYRQRQDAIRRKSMSPFQKEIDVYLQQERERIEKLEYGLEHPDSATAVYDIQVEDTTRRSKVLGPGLDLLRRRHELFRAAVRRERKQRVTLTSEPQWTNLLNQILGQIRRAVPSPAYNFRPPPTSLQKHSCSCEYVKRPAIVTVPNTTITFPSRGYEYRKYGACCQRHLFTTHKMGHVLSHPKLDPADTLGLNAYTRKKRYLLRGIAGHNQTHDVRPVARSYYDKYQREELREWQELQQLQQAGAVSTATRSLKSKTPSSATSTIPATNYIEYFDLIGHYDSYDPVDSANVFPGIYFKDHDQRLFRSSIMPAETKSSATSRASTTDTATTSSSSINLPSFLQTTTKSRVVDAAAPPKKKKPTAAKNAKNSNNPKQRHETKTMNGRNLKRHDSGDDEDDNDDDEEGSAEEEDDDDDDEAEVDDDNGDGDDNDDNGEEDESEQDKDNGGGDDDGNGNDKDSEDNEEDNEEEEVGDDDNDDDDDDDEKDEDSRQDEDEEEDAPKVNGGGFGGMLQQTMSVQQQQQQQKSNKKTPKLSPVLDYSGIHDYRDVFLFRNLYDSLISGYNYHKSGKECWLDPYGKAHKAQFPQNDMFLKNHAHWQSYLYHQDRVTQRKRPKPRNGKNSTQHVIAPIGDRSLCHYLVHASEYDGMAIYIDFAFHYWYELDIERWVLSKFYKEADERTHVVCFEDVATTTAASTTANATFDPIQQKNKTYNAVKGALDFFFPPDRANLNYSPDDPPKYPFGPLVIPSHETNETTNFTITTNTSTAQEARTAGSESEDEGSDADAGDPLAIPTASMTSEEIARLAAKRREGHATTRDPKLKEHLFEVIQQVDRDVYDGHIEWLAKNVWPCM